MNAAKVTQIIAQIIEENRNTIGAKAARKQFAAGKAQIAQLTELGIIDFMPAGYGFSDADAVINAANEKATAVWFQGEGSDVPASDLNVALNEKPIAAGDKVQWTRHIGIRKNDRGGIRVPKELATGIVIAIEPYEDELDAVIQTDSGEHRVNVNILKRI